MHPVAAVSLVVDGVPDDLDRLVEVALRILHPGPEQDGPGGLAVAGLAFRRVLDGVEVTRRGIEVGRGKRPTELVLEGQRPLGLDGGDSSVERRQFRPEFLDLLGVERMLSPSGDRRSFAC